MKTFTFIIMMIASISAFAAPCSGEGTITNMANRGAFYDVDGGMRNGGKTVTYSTRANTILVGVDTFKLGYHVKFEGEDTGNGICHAVKTTVSR